jgi:phosphoribosylanthranilate isomerase
MAIAVKICGLSTQAALAAAVRGGARFVGFVFFPPSPRCLDLDRAATIAAQVPDTVQRVGLVVDADDATLDALMARVPLDMLQLHGSETPARVAAIKDRFGVPVIKSVAVATAADLARTAGYEAVADWLLFDAHPPAGADRPGGNARAFEWELLNGIACRRPWFLAGGLEAGNVALAVRASGAKAVDVSSGVEDAPGRKSVAKIEAFLRTAMHLNVAAGAAAAAGR